ncbi:Fe2+ or Zn2+ uptake regulation protein [Endozoicomonas sp. NE35]
METMSVQKMFINCCWKQRRILAWLRFTAILNQFEEVGLLTRHHFDGAVARFELKSSSHHDHMICTDSGDIIEFNDPVIEARQQEIAREKGYELLGHSLILRVKPTERIA